MEKLDGSGILIATELSRLGRGAAKVIKSISLLDGMPKLFSPNKI